MRTKPWWFQQEREFDPLSESGSCSSPPSSSSVNGGIGGASEDGSDASVDGIGGEFVVVGCRAGAVGAGGGLGNWKAGAAEVPVVVALVGVSSIWFVPFIVGASICVGVSIKAAVVGESVGGLISCVGVVAPTPPSPC